MGIPTVGGASEADVSTVNTNTGGPPSTPPSTGFNVDWASLLNLLPLLLKAADQFSPGTQGQFGQQASGSPQQQDTIAQLLQSLPLNQGLEAIIGQLQGQIPGGEEALTRQFQEEFLPDLATQFAGRGAAGSGSFAQQASQGAERLSSMFGQQRAGIQQAGIGNLQGFLGQGLGTQISFPTFTPGTPGLGTQLAPIAGQVAGQFASNRNHQELMDLFKRTNNQVGTGGTR